VRVESRWHSIVQLFRHWSFQLGTWWSFTHTVRWQASVQASCEDTPHTVTHVLEVGSFARLPSVRSSLQGAAAARGGGAARAGGGGGNKPPPPRSTRQAAIIDQGDPHLGMTTRLQ